MLQRRKGRVLSINMIVMDIWWHIHSLMSLRDAAHAACVSRAFLRSWRCYPNLTLDYDTLASETCASEMRNSDKIDCILKNHSGCLKALTLNLNCISISHRHLDSWLCLAVKPGTEDLTLLLPKRKYNFPCSLLSDGVRNSIRYLEIGFWGELECLLSNALSLEQLAFTNCMEITHLKIPCQLACLDITAWQRLQVIENKAPNVSSFCLYGKISKVLLGDTLHMKNVTLGRSNAVCYARAELPFIVPNL
ncbi:hypothetical protein U9M48_041254 [Paspalum notatum var. saurae]|uniref:At1g61320/AtMIF1 LRR domain-containing protein n=1 Tax=Paspalum notatum var. saurae TaxID=547442 RepID=A0AAQ3UQ51_PASNO